ncbi:MAG TPA: hypothetical protein VKY38_10030 [Azoarcus sp.]|nr:hypothetical protein [Azoarcus sp.]
MDGLVALAWGLFCGGASLVGASVGWFSKPSPRVTAGMMAFGSGILMSAVAFELMGEAWHAGGLFATTIGFVVGAAMFTVGAVVLAEKGARNRKRSVLPEKSTAGVAALAIALGSVLDGVPESIVIGLSVLDGGVSLPIVAAVFLANVPEGMSSAVGMKKAGMSKTYVFGLWGGIAVLCGIGALGGYMLFHDAPAEYVAVAQGVAAGAIVAMIADTMIPEAFNETHNAAGLITAAGFLTAFLLSHAFG